MVMEESGDGTEPGPDPSSGPTIEKLIKQVDPQFVKVMKQVDPQIKKLD